jgi:uncharacterized membrane protein YfhO
MVAYVVRRRSFVPNTCYVLFFIIIFSVSSIFRQRMRAQGHPNAFYSGVVYVVAAAVVAVAACSLSSLEEAVELGAVVGVLGVVLEARVGGDEGVLDEGSVERTTLPTGLDAVGGLGSRPAR